MKNNRASIFKYIFLLLVSLNSLHLKAQDPQFGHFYNNAMLYNPAFAGNVDLGRFALSYRNQWPGLKNSFVSFSGSYEHYFNNLNSGMGLQFITDKAGSGGLTTTGFNYMYSYQISINRKLALLGGLKAGYYTRKFDFNKFVFGDQIARDGASASIENRFRDNINYANFGFGAVLYHLEKYWLGLSFDHLNQPNNAFSSAESNLPIKTAIQGGWNFEVNKGLNGSSKSTITPAFLYKAQEKWDQLDIGAYYTTSPMIFGLWYRGIPLKSNKSSIPNVDALMLLVGYKYDRISFAYSYDITISALSGNTNGAHEISLILDYPKSKRRKPRYFRVPCPKF